MDAANKYHKKELPDGINIKCGKIRLIANSDDKSLSQKQVLNVIMIQTKSIYGNSVSVKFIGEIQESLENYHVTDIEYKFTLDSLTSIKISELEKHTALKIRFYPIEPKMVTKWQRVWRELRSKGITWE